MMFDTQLPDSYLTWKWKLLIKKMIKIATFRPVRMQKHNRDNHLLTTFSPPPQYYSYRGQYGPDFCWNKLIMLLCIGYFIRKKYDGEPSDTSNTTTNNFNFGHRKKGRHCHKPDSSRKCGWIKRRSNYNFFFP